MFSWLKRIVVVCFAPLRRYSPMSKDEARGHLVSDEEGDDPLLWSHDLGRHSVGEFSYAVLQANELVEDNSQVETAPSLTFAGVYDGHGGPDVSRYIANNLFLHLMRLSQENGTISEETVRNSFSSTEKGFLTFVSRAREITPAIATIGSCCLVGIIWKGTLYIANVGDSRAVVGCLGKSNNILAEQLTSDHNANVEEIRQELRSQHPDDSQIVVLKNGAWRIKGIIQVSRSIGDAYLKNRKFAVGPSLPRFYLPEPIRKPVLSAEPSIYTRVLRPQDKFFIFASDGLWEHLTNQSVVEMVHRYPRTGIAKRLVKKAVQEAVRKREMRYADLKKVSKGIRRFFHDDITVIVIFIDPESSNSNTSTPSSSVRAFVDAVGTSNV